MICFVFQGPNNFEHYHTTSRCPLFIISAPVPVRLLGFGNEPKRPFMATIDGFVSRSASPFIADVDFEAEEEKIYEN